MPLIAVLWLTVSCGVSGQQARLVYEAYRPVLKDGQVYLDYSRVIKKPVRFARVSFYEDGEKTGHDFTDQNGYITIDHSSADLIEIDAYSQIDTQKVSDSCRASWELSVLNNTDSNSLYSIQVDLEGIDDSEDLTVTAPMSYSNGQYTVRSGAPFAVLDSIITGHLWFCRNSGGEQTFPALSLYWSKDNSTGGGSYASGNIGTSFYTGNGISNSIYLLGKTGDDTDELDHHVVLHEYGHYLELSFSRSDSPGGRHYIDQLLHPAMAFSEGWANAFATAVLADPVYIDTNGAGQADGFFFTTDTFPEADGKNIYTEESVQALFYRLFTDPAVSKTRLFEVMNGEHRNSPVFISLHGFMVYFCRGVEPAACGLDYWQSVSYLNQPADALCAGSCSFPYSGGDIWDSDNDLGQGYALSQTYPTGEASYDADFWQLYAPLDTGLNGPDGHYQTAIGTEQTYVDYPSNKLGFRRFYRIMPTTPLQIDLAGIVIDGLANCPVSSLLATVYRAGRSQGSGYYGGCGSFSTSTDGENRVLEIKGAGSLEVDSFSLQLTAPKPAPPVSAVATYENGRIRLVVQAVPGCTARRVRLSAVSGLSFEPLQWQDSCGTVTRYSGLVSLTEGETWLQLSVSVVKGTQKRWNRSLRLPVNGIKATKKGAGRQADSGSGSEDNGDNSGAVKKHYIPGRID